MIFNLFVLFFFIRKKPDTLVYYQKQLERDEKNLNKKRSDTFQASVQSEPYRVYMWSSPYSSYYQSVVYHH